jgi:2-polyprenyl-6-methoxyphenol hydroxylase-like FAD-dependent oxidoreductase
MKRQTFDYDAIIVGGRVAGASTGMLLARRGYRVLVVERGTRASDTVSTHALMRAGVMQLERWGLLARVIDSGTPAVRRVMFHYGDDSLEVEPKVPLFAPRRTVLDPIIADAARAAGVDLRFGVSVSRVLRDADGGVVGVAMTEEDGTRAEVTAKIVIGADGVRSRVARVTGARRYVQGHGATAFVYSYFDDASFDGYEWIYRPRTTAGIIPTNGGILAWVAMSATSVGTQSRDPEACFWSRLGHAAPALAARVSNARRTERWHSWSGSAGYHRQSWGRGWALVGDAAHFTDPSGAHGLTDALRDAEFLARAIDRWLSGVAPFADALDNYQRARDMLSLPMFDAVDRIASHEWDLPEVRALHIALSKEMQNEAEVVAAFDADSAAGVA